MTGKGGDGGCQTVGEKESGGVGGGGEGGRMEREKMRPRRGMKSPWKVLPWGLGFRQNPMGGSWRVILESGV